MAFLAGALGGGALAIIAVGSIALTAVGTAALAPSIVLVGSVGSAGFARSVAAALPGSLALPCWPSGVATTAVADPVAGGADSRARNQPPTPAAATRTTMPARRHVLDVPSWPGPGKSLFVWPSTGVSPVWTPGP